MSTRRSKAKTSKYSRIPAYRISGGRIIMSNAKASACVPAIRQSAQTARGSVSVTNYSGPMRRDSARSYARSLLGLPRYHAQTPQKYAYASRKTCRTAQPRPRRLPGVRPNCDTCESAHETMADVMACVAQQTQLEPPLELVELPHPVSSSQPELPLHGPSIPAELTLHLLVDPLVKSPVRSPSHSISRTSSVQSNIQFYNNLSRAGHREHDSHTLYTISTVSACLPPNRRIVSNHLQSSTPALIRRASAETKTAPKLQTQPHAVAETPSAESSSVRPVHRRARATKGPQSTRLDSTPAGLRRRPEVSGLRREGRSGAVSRIDTPPKVLDYYRFPTFASDGSSVSCDTQVTPGRTRASIPISTTMNRSAGNSQFSDYEWGHLEVPLCLRSETSASMSVAHETLAATTPAAAAPAANGAAFVEASSGDNTSAGCPSMISDDFSSDIENRSEENWCPPCFSALGDESTPSASVLAAYADKYLRKVHDKVEDWVQRTPFAEGPELWRVRNNPLPLLSLQIPAIHSSTNCFSEEKCGTVDPRSSISAMEHPRAYQPTDRWQTNSRIRFGSDPFEGPIPIPAGYLARAQRESLKRRPVFDSPSGPDFAPHTFSFKNPRPAPAPPNQGRIEEWASRVQADTNSVAASKISDSAIDPDVARYHQVHQLPINAAGSEIPVSRFSATTDSSADAHANPSQDGAFRTFSDVFAHLAAKPANHFSDFSFSVKTTSEAAFSDYPVSSMPSLGSVAPPPPPRPLEPVPTPVTTPRAPSFIGSTTSLATNDTIDDLVNDLANDVDRQLRDGRDLLAIIMEWNSLTHEVEATTQMGELFAICLEALREQHAEEVANGPVVVVGEGGDADGTRINTDWGQRAALKNLLRLEMQGP